MVSTVSSAIAFSEKGSVPIFRHLCLTSSSTLPTRLGINIRVSLGERLGLRDWKLEAKQRQLFGHSIQASQLGARERDGGELTDPSSNQPASGTVPGPDAAAAPGWVKNNHVCFSMAVHQSPTLVRAVPRAYEFSVDGQSSVYCLGTAPDWGKPFGSL